MKILNFGSLNIDHVYEVAHFVQAGETLASQSLENFPGGKGLNQSIAAARAGACIYHAGRVGKDGAFLVELLSASGADISLIHTGEGPTGHAIIQVSPQGENCILLFAGENRRITSEQIAHALKQFAPGDLLLVQNETNAVADLLCQAHQKGMQVAFNPSPIDDALTSLPLDYVDWFILNEIEAQALTGEQRPDKAAQTMLTRWPKAHIVLTLGAQGALYLDAGQRLYQPALPADVVDTTAAGDTFTGYFLAAVTSGQSPKQALLLAAQAAALAISVKGAAVSIPTKDQVAAFYPHG